MNKKDINIFLIILLVILYLKDFTILANIILISYIITLVIKYLGI